MSAIDERLRLLRRGVGERGAKANWGPLQTAIAGRQEAEAKLAEARQADAQLTSARETLATVDARVIEIRERIATLEALMASTRECRELRKRYEDLKAIFDGIEQQRAKVEATITRRDQLREELEKLALAEADPVSLRTALARASAVQSEADRLGTERSALQGRLHALPAPYLDTLALRASLQAVERGMLGPRWLIGLVIGLAVLALGAWAFSQPYAAVGFFLLAIFLAYVSVSRGQREAAAFYTSLGVRDALDADAKIREAEDLFRKIGSLELAIASAEASAAELPNAEELRERLDAYDTMRQELTHAEGALAALPTPEELAERRRPLGSEISRIEDELKSLPGGDMTAEDEVHLTRELSDARLLLDSLAGEKREAEKAVAVGEASERELVELEDALAYWQAEESRLLDDEAALKQAREWLIAAGSSTHDMLAAPLGERISPRFAAVTRGRYTKVDVATNAKTLELTPVNADGRAVSFEQLSRGTRDQFLLAVRLALGEAIARDGGPVYFLDDPLLHFDVARRQEALTMLIELAATRQIILVTHDEALLAALPDAHIIPMEAPLPTAALA
ncbi:MAG: chromosome segregation protein [bacterium ADurb.Bin429]|nr:MAG: chromosome segregation protein [bacterium ADurb.Bin429]